MHATNMINRLSALKCFSMKTLLFALSLLSLTASCKKNKGSNTSGLQGVWVETTLRLDTLDFEINNLIDNSSGYAAVNFKTNTYNDTVLNPNYPVNHSSFYHYYLDSRQTVMNLKSAYSSYSGFFTYKFALQANGKQFSIDKFYLRRSLPSTIEFIRIK